MSRIGGHLRNGVLRRKRQRHSGHRRNGHRRLSVTITYTPPEGGDAITLVVPTDSQGFYQSGLTPSGTTYTVSVQIPPAMTASPADNPATDDEHDSDGVPDGHGNTVAHFTLPADDTNGDAS